MEHFIVLVNCPLCTTTEEYQSGKYVQCSFCGNKRLVSNMKLLMHLNSAHDYVEFMKRN
jgi:DNA-directed RNA polymerase subunit RPC12/RpoP